MFHNDPKVSSIEKVWKTNILNFFPAAIRTHYTRTNSKYRERSNYRSKVGSE